jgi:hypothetical protein
MGESASSSTSFKLLFSTNVLHVLEPMGSGYDDAATTWWTAEGRMCWARYTRSLSAWQRSRASRTSCRAGGKDICARQPMEVGHVASEVRRACSLGLEEHKTDAMAPSEWLKNFGRVLRTCCSRSRASIFSSSCWRNVATRDSASWHTVRASWDMVDDNTVITCVFSDRHGCENVVSNCFSRVMNPKRNAEPDILHRAQSDSEQKASCKSLTCRLSLFKEKHWSMTYRHVQT